MMYDIWIVIYHTSSVIYHMWHIMYTYDMRYIMYTASSISYVISHISCVIYHVYVIFHTHTGFFLERIRGDYDGAEEMYLRALNVDPSHIVTLCNLGLVMYTYV